MSSYGLGSAYVGVELDFSNISKNLRELSRTLENFEKQQARGFGSSFGRSFQQEMEPRKVFRSFELGAPQIGRNIGSVVGGGLTSGMVAAITAGNLISSTIEGAIRKGIDAALGSLPGQMGSILGDAFEGNGGLREAMGLEQQTEQAANALVTLANLPYEEARKIIKGLNQDLAESAAALPGTTQGFKDFAATIGDNVLNAYKQTDGSLDVDAYTDSLKRLSEAYGVLDAGSINNIMDTSMAVSRALGGGSIAELRNLRFFENQPAITAQLEERIQAAGAESLRDLTIEGRVDLLLELGEANVTEEMKARASESIGGQIESFRTSLFDQENGVFGVMRDLDSEADGEQSVFTAFRDTVGDLLGDDGLFNTVAAEAQAAGLKMADPMEAQRGLILALNEAIATAKAGVQDFFASDFGKGIIDLINGVQDGIGRLKSGLVDAFKGDSSGLLAKSLEVARGILAQILENASAVGSAIGGWFQENREGIKETLAAVLESAKGLEPAFDAAREIALALWEAFGNVASELIDSGAIQKGLKAVVDLVVGVSRTIADIVSSDLFKGIVATLATVIANVATLLVDIASYTEFWEGVIKTIAVLVGGAMAVAFVAVHGTTILIVGAIASIQSLSETLPQYWQALKDITEAWWNILKLKAREAIQWIDDKTGNILSTIGGWAPKVADTVLKVTGLKDGFEAVAGFAENIKNHLKNAFPWLEKLINKANEMEEMEEIENAGAGGSSNGAQVGNETFKKFFGIESRKDLYILIANSLTEGVAKDTQSALDAAVSVANRLQMDSFRTEFGTTASDQISAPNQYEAYTRFGLANVKDAESAAKAVAKVWGVSFEEALNYVNELQSKLFTVEDVRNSVEFTSGVVSYRSSQSAASSAGYRSTDARRSASDNYYIEPGTKQSYTTKEEAARVKSALLEMLEGASSYGPVGQNYGPAFPGSSQVVGVVGDTGSVNGRKVSTGDHLDIRYDRAYAEAQGLVTRDGHRARVSDDVLSRFTVDGKDLTKHSDLITSDHGYRTHPTFGGSQHHDGIDYGFRGGTEIEATVPVKSTEVFWDEGGGGWVTRVEFEDGVAVMLLHQHESVKGKVGNPGKSASSGSSGPYSGGGGVDLDSAVDAAQNEIAAAGNEAESESLRAAIVSERRVKELQRELKKQGERIQNENAIEDKKIADDRKARDLKAENELKALDEDDTVGRELKQRIAARTKIEDVRDDELRQVERQIEDFNNKRRIKLAQSDRYQSALEANEDARDSNVELEFNEEALKGIEAEIVGADFSAMLNALEARKTAIQEAANLQLEGLAIDAEKFAKGFDKSTRELIRSSEDLARSTGDTQFIEGQQAKIEGLNLQFDENAKKLKARESDLLQLKEAEGLSEKQAEDLAKIQGLLANEETMRAEAIAQVNKETTEYLRSTTQEVQALRDLDAQMNGSNALAQHQANLRGISQQYQETRLSADKLVKELEALANATGLTDEQQQIATKNLEDAKAARDALNLSEQEALKTAEDKFAIQQQITQVEAAQQGLGLASERAGSLLERDERAAERLSKYSPFEANAQKRLNQKRRLGLQLAQETAAVKRRELDLLLQLEDAQRAARLGDTAQLDALSMAGLGSEDGIRAYTEESSGMLQERYAQDIADLPRQYPDAFENFRQGIEGAFSSGLQGGLMAGVNRIKNGEGFNPLQVLKDTFWSVFDNVMQLGVQNITQGITGKIFGREGEGGGGIFGSLFGNNDQDPIEKLPEAGETAGQLLADGGFNAGQFILDNARQAKALLSGGLPGLPGAEGEGGGLAKRGFSFVENAVDLFGGGGDSEGGGSITDFASGLVPSEDTGIGSTFGGGLLEGVLSLTEQGVDIGKGFKAETEGFGEKEGQGLMGWVKDLFGGGGGEGGAGGKGGGFLSKIFSLIGPLFKLFGGGKANKRYGGIIPSYSSGGIVIPNYSLGGIIGKLFGGGGGGGGGGDKKGGILSTILGLFGGGGQAGSGGGGGGGLINMLMRLFGGSGTSVLDGLEGGALAFQNGGIIPNYMTGGLIEAIGKAAKKEGPHARLIMASAGEGIITRGAMKNIGEGGLKAINSGKVRIPNYMAGGLISQSGQPGGDYASPLSREQMARESMPKRLEVEYFKQGEMSFVSKQQMEQVVEAANQDAIEKAQRSVFRGLRGDISLRQNVGLA